MKSRNKLIVIFFVLALSIFAVIQLVILPQQEREQEAYQAAPLDPETHDLNSILEYQNPYMGNASNLINLFGHLPLKEYPQTYSQDSDTFTFEIHYEVSSEEIAKADLQQRILYNSTAAFALIDNLQVIRYRFLDQTYMVDKEHFLLLYSDPPALLNQTDWSLKVQKKLAEPKFVWESAQKVITEAISKNRSGLS